MITYFTPTTLTESTPYNQIIGLVPVTFDGIVNEWCCYQGYRKKHAFIVNESCCYQGYRKKHAFIATQMPLPNTQVDFWRMVDDFDVAAIVMINPLTPGDEVGLLQHVIFIFVWHRNSSFPDFARDIPFIILRMSSST